MKFCDANEKTVTTLDKKKTLVLTMTRLLGASVACASDAALKTLAR